MPRRSVPAGSSFVGPAPASPSRRTSHYELESSPRGAATDKRRGLRGVRPKRVVLVGLFGLILLVGALGALVAVPMARDLRAADEALAGFSASSGTQGLTEARRRLANVRATLDSLPARLLSVVPVARQNLAAAEDVSAAAGDVLDSAASLASAADALEDDEVVRDGAVDLELLSTLKRPLETSATSLEELRQVAVSSRSGWLLPPVWDALDGVAKRTGALAADARSGLGALGVAGPLLGANEKRTYLVMLVNNAELRGSGGVLSAVGTLEAADGRLRMGRFYSVHQLETRPAIKVRAPAEYERRFAIYKANSTIWLNTTWSADFRDDAVVAARLFERVTGVATDGVLQVDPVALASLLPPDSSLRVPLLGLDVPAGGVDEFVFSDAYAQFEDQDLRRRALLLVGAQVFDAVLTRGFDRSALTDFGDLFASGHLRFAPLRSDEAHALEEIGASGDLRPPPSDTLLVTAQNFGSANGDGTKLDYWAHRELAHDCTVDSGTARCSTTVTIANDAPDGLTTYVAGAPYGLLRNYVEIFVPSSARLGGVTLNGSPAEFRAEPQSGHTSVGTFVKLEQGEQASFSVSYRLDASAGYSLRATPQPLATDARLELSLTLPPEWELRGGSLESDGNRYSYKGAFNRSFEVSAEPSARAGVSALWERLVRFWREPVF